MDGAPMFVYVAAAIAALAWAYKQWALARGYRLEQALLHDA